MNDGNLFVDLHSISPGSYISVLAYLALLVGVLAFIFAPHPAVQLVGLLAVFGGLFGVGAGLMASDDAKTEQVHGIAQAFTDQLGVTVVGDQDAAIWNAVFGGRGAPAPAGLPLSVNGSPQSCLLSLIEDNGDDSDSVLLVTCGGAPLPRLDAVTDSQDGFSKGDLGQQPTKTAGEAPAQKQTTTTRVKPVEVPTAKIPSAY